MKYWAFIKPNTGKFLLQNWSMGSHQASGKNKIGSLHIYNLDEIVMCFLGILHISPKFISGPKATNKSEFLMGTQEWKINSLPFPYSFLKKFVIGV